MTTFAHFTRKLADGTWDDMSGVMHHAPRSNHTTMCGIFRAIPPEPEISKTGWTRTNWSLGNVNCERCLRAMEKQREART